MVLATPQTKMGFCWSLYRFLYTMNYTVSLCWLCSTVCFIIYYCGHRDCLLLLCTGCMHSRRPHDGYFLYFVQYWVLLINIDVLCKDVVKNSTAVSMFLSFRASLTIDCNLQTDFRVLRWGGVSFLSLRIDFVWTVGSRQNWCLAWFCFVCLETEQQINEYEATYSSTAYFAVPSL